MTFLGKNEGTVGRTRPKARIDQPLVNKNLVFAHKATAGQTTLDLTNLAPPTEMLANGFVAPSSSDILAARLSRTRGRLTLVSSLKDKMIDYLDYRVIDSGTIIFSDPLEENEIIEGTLESNSDLTPVSGERIVKTYILPAGQTTLNLGNEYKVGKFINENIGVITVYVNGSQVFRNTLNSSSNLDKQYYEVDSGNGYGTLIEFNVAPAVIDHEVMVDFGHRAITDDNALGLIESLSGSLLKIATDLADVAGTDLLDYFSASPSEVERRVFGDTVLGLMRKVSELEEPVGTVTSSLLTESQYQSQRGTNWVLANGRNVSGSTYASITGSATIPDLRGLFLRGKDNGRGLGGGEIGLGVYQADAFQGWQLGMRQVSGGGTIYYGSNRADNSIIGGTGGTNHGLLQMLSTAQGSVSKATAYSDGTNGTPRIAAETRPKNVTVNYFIKIN